MNLWTRVVILVSLLFISGMRVAAGEPMLLHYSPEDGIPSSMIYNITRDNKGYLWLCTDKGIARYNGIKFETFTTFNGLPDNEIFFFGEDKLGRIWLASYNGELCYYQNDTFHTAANTPFLQMPLKRTFIQDIVATDDSSVLIVYSNHTNWLNIKGAQCSIRDFSTVLASHDTSYLYPGKISDNEYISVYNDKVIHVDSNAHITNIHRHPGGKRYRYSVATHQRYLYNEDSIYTLDYTPLAAINKDAYAHSKIYHLCIYNGNVFYCTDKGLYINNNIHILKGVKVSGVAEDRNGNIWITTLDNGLYSMNKDLFSIIKEEHCYKGSVSYCKADSNNLFYTTSNNNLYRVQGGNTTCLFNFSDYIPNKKEAANQEYLITEDYTYYGFFDKYICVIDAVNTPHPKAHIYYGDFYGGYKKIFRNKDRLYLKRFFSVEYIDLATLQQQRNKKPFPVVRLSPCTKDVDRIFGMTQQENGTIWLSTIDTTYALADCAVYPQAQFNNIRIKWLYSANGLLIGSTHDNQLFVHDTKTGETMEDIAPEQNCIWDKIYKLDNEHCLINTNNQYRILTIDTKSKKQKYKVQAIENPYIPTDCEDICSDGQYCYFFKNGSIITLKNNLLSVVAKAPEIFFTQLKTKQQHYATDSEITIPYRQSENISISFSTLSFAGKDVTYQYAIQNAGNTTNNWIDISGDINLAKPAPGTYNVMVRVKSISSEYSHPATITLTILNPLWATWWFLSLCVLCVLLALIVFMRHRISSSLRKRQQKHEIEIRQMQAEYKALNALMNPHFIFNTLNNVQDLINKNDKQAANEYLRFFADLIRQNMYNISKELIPLQKEIALVANYLLLEKLRFEDTLTYHISVDEDIDTTEIMIPPLLIQPLVENAIKHGIYPLESTDGCVNINIYEQNETVFIEVRDNGVGMQQDTHPEEEPHGLNNIRQRIEQLNIIQNKQIRLYISEISEAGEKWTTVTVIIPISK